MTTNDGSARWRKIPAWAAVIFGITLVPASFALAASLPLFRQNFTQINESGFGDCMNSFPRSSAWFKGKLYIGTSRGDLLQYLGEPDFHCQGTDFAAEIWRYTPETMTWKRVYKSAPSEIPDPLQPGQFLARDNGFRGMILFNEPSGGEALYVAGEVYPISADDRRRPRILRTTEGETFEAVPQDPGTILGDITATSFRGMAVFNDRLFVAAGNELEGGVILEANDPAGGNNNFTRVSPPDISAFELQVFNGFLYVGTTESSPGAGFSVLKTDALTWEAPGSSFLKFSPVVTHGAFKSPVPDSHVLSMGVFAGKLYVSGLSDLIRINPDNSWQLVVGNRRTGPEGQSISPISGRPSGFGNPFTGHLWRMQQHDRWLYVGTLDIAVFLRNWPFIGPLATTEAGFDLWASPAWAPGVFWFRISRDGFGNKSNYGVRSLVSTPLGLFLGTVNPWDGTQIWLGAH